METDVTLRSASRTLVIEAKYYRETLSSGQYGKKTLHSHNLYQLFAYLKNLEANGGLDRSAEGIILYPCVARNLNLSFSCSTA